MTRAEWAFTVDVFDVRLVYDLSRPDGETEIEATCNCDVRATGKSCRHLTLARAAVVDRCGGDGTTVREGVPNEPLSVNESPLE